jgi:hypothetical protein
MDRLVALQLALFADLAASINEKGSVDEGGGGGREDGRGTSMLLASA